MDTIESLYLAAAVLGSVAFALYADNRLFVLVMLIWLLGYPILIQPEFIPKLPILEIGMQPDRLLLIMLVLIALLRFSDFGTGVQFSPTDDLAAARTFGFEKFLYLYGAVAAVTVGILTQGVSAERLINIVGFQLLFVLVYFLSRNLIGPQDFVVLCTAIWGLAIFSGLVSIVQFFVDPYFLRVGVTRAAYGEFFRANGVFLAEYDHGFFQIVALLMTFYVRPRPNWAKLVWVIAPISVLITVHRLSWISLVIVLVTASLLALREERAIVWGSMAITAVLLLVYIQILPLQTWLDNVAPDLIKTRLLQDTLSGRFNQYSFALDMVFRYPLGVGSYEGLTYQQEAWRHGLPTVGEWAIIVHNGYLAAIVRHGIIGGIAFVGFVLGATLQLGHQILRGKAFHLPFLVMCAYLLYNLSNDFSNLGNQIGVFLALVLGASITQSLRVSRDIDQPEEVLIQADQADTELAVSR